MGNHFVLKDFQTLADQQVLNVYVYENTSGAGDGTLLAAAFFANILSTLIVGMQASAVLHDHLEFVCLEDPTDFGSLITAVPGGVAGDVLPVQDCYAIRLDRSSRESRNGQKRLAGVPEAYNNIGQLSGSAFLQLQVVAEAMATVLIDADGNEYTPRIWRRPVGAGIGTFYGIQTATASDFVTTQNTRKRGRGA